MMVGIIASLLIIAKTMMRKFFFQKNYSTN